MAQCRKCGASPLTRRRAGVFSCKKCGVQPGPDRWERGGNFSSPTDHSANDTAQPVDYVFKTLSPNGLPALGVTND